jgi:hypothetical protein
MVNCTTNVTDTDKPEPGHLTICVDCGNISIFGPDLEIVKPTDRQIEGYKNDPVAWGVVLRGQKLVRALKRINRKESR